MIIVLAIWIAIFSPRPIQQNAGMLIYFNERVAFYKGQDTSLTSWLSRQDVGIEVTLGADAYQLLDNAKTINVESYVLTEGKVTTTNLSLSYVPVILSYRPYRTLSKADTCHWSIRYQSQWRNFYFRCNNTGIAVERIVERQ